MQLFYYPNLDNSISQFIFSEEESKHIVKVLRKTEGDILFITNGKGYFFDAKILIANHKRCKMEVISSKKKHAKRHWLHMVIAPTKLNDRYEWFLEKATEIGIDEITPIICEHSERKVIKIDRLKKVIESAMKQSLQAFLPKLNEAISFKEYIEQSKDGLLFIAHCEDDEKMELKRRVAPDKDVTILIGPEGDFSHSEITTAEEKGFIPISLGKNRLRTETAGIVACATVALINNS
ncbi:MAG: 16S rRNA (uracil(1498)-N(3))-methyltransferase [Cellulophaga sp.]